MIPIKGTVVVICAAFADYIDLPAFRTPKGGVIIGDSHSKLRHILDADRNNRPLGSATCDYIVRDVDAVEVKGVLIASRSGESASIVAEPPAVRGLEGRRHRLQSEQLPGVTSQGW